MEREKIKITNKGGKWEKGYQLEQNIASHTDSFDCITSWGNIPLVCTN